MLQHSSELFCVLFLLSIIKGGHGATSNMGCPSGHFPCKNDTRCVARQFQCDGHRDCPDGTDETNCTDIHGGLKVMTNMFKSITLLNTTDCELEWTPSGCFCQWTWLYCQGMGWASVSGTADDHPDTELHRSARHQVETLVLNYNTNIPTEIPNDTFAHYPELSKISLRGTQLQRLSPAAFRGVNHLIWLILQDNHLDDAAWTAIENITSLMILDLSNNKIQLNRQRQLQKLPYLTRLNLEANRISVLRNGVLDAFPDLTTLTLSNNGLYKIEDEAFQHLSLLLELNLSFNKLTILTAGVFVGLRSLEKLKLDSNPLSTFSDDAFRPLYSLKSLSLKNINMNNATITTFDPLHQLERIYFERFRYCSLVPQVRICEPRTDGVSSVEHLLGHPLLRLSVWLVALFTCFGNALVLCSRIANHEDNHALSLFIRNLAAADLLMGLYLLVIGTKDQLYRDNYNTHAAAWMGSWTCLASGVVAITSSEASVLLLAYMSFERCLRIMRPFADQQSHPLITLALIWCAGLCLALGPAVRWSSSDGNAFYGSNSMCVPLHIDEPFMLGWQYSAFLFLGINGCSMLVIAVAYVTMFVSIQRTQRATPLADTDFIIRFAWIVFTDCACWMPIIVLKLLALRPTPIPPDLYGWVVVLILPINSAVNPFLYTFTTTKYKEVFTRKALFHWIQLVKRKNSSDTDSSMASSKRSSHKVGSCSQDMQPTSTDGNVEEKLIAQPNGHIVLGSIESCF